MADSIILKTEKELSQERKGFKELLSRIKEQEFWRDHFKRHQFEINADSFDWNYWRTIPLLTKEEFSNGTNLRLRDAAENMKLSIYNYLLRVTSGTTSGKPSLFLHYINETDKTIEDLDRGIRIWQPNHIGLRWALTGILLNKKNNTGDYQFLVIDPYKMNKSMAAALASFRAKSINGLASSIVRFAVIFAQIPEICGLIKKIIFGGDFISNAHLKAIKTFFPRIDNKMIVSDYIMTECGRMGSFCPYLKNRFGGYSAYHPAVRNGMIEIIEPDEFGFGEIVVSKIEPRESAIIRYRTGDIGKAVKEVCECGNEWSFIFIGRLNFDYIKCAGTLITRVELERVCNELSDYIEEWRSEARERLISGELLGELKIKIKPTRILLDLGQDGIKEISKKIADNLFITPKKTLSELTSEGKFLPLEIEVVYRFPYTQKKILLRKVDLED